MPEPIIQQVDASKNDCEQTALKRLLANIAREHLPGINAKTSQEVLEKAIPEVIIILDGTWRKAKKIYYSNPQLQQLPCIELKHLPRSDYRIRKAPGEGALSTVEATVALLREASQTPAAHQSLLNTFEVMIEQQISSMGQEVFLKNYPQTSDRYQ